MSNPVRETGQMTRLTSTGITVITSGYASILGVSFVGTATGGIQFFAGTTGSASMTPMIAFCATTSAVIQGFSPMFLRFPADVSGNGFMANVQASADPNFLLYWVPAGGP